LKYKAIWDITEYENDDFHGKFEQDSFEVEASTIQEAIAMAHEEAKLRFQGSAHDNCAFCNIRKLIDEKGAEYPQSQ